MALAQIGKRILAITAIGAIAPCVIAPRAIAKGVFVANIAYEKTFYHSTYTRHEYATEYTTAAIKGFVKGFSNVIPLQTPVAYVVLSPIMIPTAAIMYTYQYFDDSRRILLKPPVLS